MTEGRFTINRGPLTSREIVKAEIELRETPDVVSKEIENLRKLIKAEPGLVWNDTDEFLTIFLRASHWYSASALQLIKRICEFRTKNSSIFTDLEVRGEVQYFKSNVVNILTERDQEGRRILILNNGAVWNPDIVNSDKMFQLLYIVHLAFNDPITQVNGVVGIVDYKGMGMKQVKAHTPSSAKRLLTFIQHMVPVRLKAMHVVNEPVIFNVAFTIIKPFIKEKLKTRMFFHGSNMGSLHAHISPDCLPEDYGGKLPKINYGGEEWFPAILGAEEEIKAAWNPDYVEKHFRLLYLVHLASIYESKTQI